MVELVARAALLFVLTARTEGGAATYEAEVFFESTGGTPDCSATPDATQTLSAGACDCLYKKFGQCVASVKLGTDTGGGEDTISTNIYALGTCDGTNVGGDTHIVCDKCNSVSLLSGGVAVKFTCPFSFWGICGGRTSIKPGTQCILFAIMLVLGSLAACAAVAKAVKKKQLSPLGVSLMVNTQQQFPAAQQPQFAPQFVPQQQQQNQQQQYQQYPAQQQHQPAQSQLPYQQLQPQQPGGFLAQQHQPAQQEQTGIYSHPSL